MTGTKAPTLAEVHSFLLGERPLNGAWFGERPPGERPFWWRTVLMAAIEAERPQPVPGTCVILSRPPFERDTP